MINAPNGDEINSSENEILQNNNYISMNILNHIRYCETVYCPRYLLSLLVDILVVLPHTMQVEIISTLPGKEFKSVPLYLDHVMLCYVMLCYVMLCYVMLCHVSNVMLCCVMLSYVM